MGLFERVSNMESTKITALYCRISREDEQADISSSIETQKSYLKRYANEHRMLFTKFYIDDGFSGTNFVRPGFSELLKDIESGFVEAVITKDLSRLGRDYLTTGYYIEHYFPMNEVRYIAINDQVDTILDQNELAPFRNIMNEWYARDISNKIRSAYHTKALNGEFTGPFPPYGYDKNPLDKHRLIINRSQSGIVKRIFELFGDGISVFKISKILKRDEILTPRAELNRSTKKYESKNEKAYPFEWSTKTILNILENEEYTGNIVCNRHQTKSFKNKKLLENHRDKWIISQNKHEPIIDFATFQQVQKMIQLTKRAPRTEHLNVFKGKVRCEQCGKTLTLSIRPDRNTYGTFDCSTFRRYGKARCGSHYITYEHLYSAVFQSINLLIKNVKGNKNWLTKHLDSRNDATGQLGFLETEVHEKNSRIQTIDDIIKKLYENYILEKIGEDKYYQLDKSYDEERLQLAKKVKDLLQQISELKKYESKIASFVQIISKFDELKEVTQNIIDDLIEKIVISNVKDNENKRKILIHYNYIGNL